MVMVAPSFPPVTLMPLMIPVLAREFWMPFRSIRPLSIGGLWGRMFLDSSDEKGLRPPVRTPKLPEMEPMAIFIRLLSRILIELNATKNVNMMRKSEPYKTIVLFLAGST